MRIRRAVYYLLGICFIVLNIMAYPGDEGPRKTDTAAVIGYYIGFNLGFVAGILLLYVGYKINRKIRVKESASVFDNYMSRQERYN